MTTIQVINTWGGLGTLRNPMKPNVVKDHPPLSWQDVTGVSGKPGVGDPCTTKMIVNDTTLAAIQGDSTYSGNVTILG